MKVNPTVRQLICFQMLARSGSFSKAATALGVSQPSLSQQIRGLEEILGLKLVLRGRKSELLPAGRDLLEECDRVLEGLDAFLEKAELVRTGRRRKLRLGSSPTIGPYILPQVVGKLAIDDPGLALEITEDNTIGLIERCQQRQFDLIVTQLPVPDSDLIVRRLFREKLVLAVPKSHRLAHQADVHLTDLEGEDLVSLGPQYALSGQTAAICRQYGAKLLSQYVGNNLFALLKMAELNNGLALVPAIFAFNSMADDSRLVTFRELKGRAVWRSIGLVFSDTKEIEEPVKLLSAHIRRTAQKDYGTQIVVEADG
ncbi:MAG: LysR family transcriptional regulator [Pseudomonadota bacterium]